MTSAARTLLAVLGAASLSAATLAQAPASSGVASSADIQKIYAETEKEFFYKVVDAQLTFETDADGKVTAVVLHQNGLTPRAVRAN